MTRISVLPITVPVLTEAIERAGATLTDDPNDADAIVWIDPYDPSKLKDVLKSSKARWIQLPFAGVEPFLELMDDSRIWTCAKGIYGPATAEHAFALTMAAAHQLHQHARAHEWQHYLGERRLHRSTALIIGTGGIGESFARFAQPFEMRVLAANRSGTPVEWAEQTVASTSMTPLINEADWIIVAAASTPSTRHLIDRAFIEHMKQDAWIINIARGSLVDTEALVEALQQNRIAGAALDVTDPEPLPADHPLWRLPNTIITSHNANPFRVALQDLSDRLERNIRLFEASRPLEGLVNQALGY